MEDKEYKGNLPPSNSKVHVDDGMLKWSSNVVSPPHGTNEGVNIMAKCKDTNLQ